MDSPSRNPLLLDQSNDERDQSGDETATEDIAESVSGATTKEAYRRSPSTPTDRFNFAYFVFYFIGM